LLFIQTKNKARALVELKCFSSKALPDYQIKSLKKELSFIAKALLDELAQRIEIAKLSVAYQNY
jgi:hypothetical protein